MSMFDRYTVTEKVEAYRVFLNLPKKNFLRDVGIITTPRSKGDGRLKRYPEGPVKALEARVNKKAARVDASDTTMGERYVIARDYNKMNDAQVARAIGVSRELVRR